jgi:hypothetical protein
MLASRNVVGHRSISWETERARGQKEQAVFAYDLLVAGYKIIFLPAVSSLLLSLPFL